MQGQSSPMIANANMGTEQVFGKNPLAVRAIAAVMQKLHALYPTKFAANVAARARVSTRAVEHWTAGSREMSAEAFISLLVSDDGATVLEAVILSLPARERPRWWLRYANTARLAHIEQQQAAQDEEIKQLRLSLLK